MADDPNARTVARSRSMRVDRCGCGSLHVHLPHLTLHLSPAGLAELQGVLSQALRTIATADEQLGLRLVHDAHRVEGDDYH